MDHGNAESIDRIAVHVIPVDSGNEHFALVVVDKQTAYHFNHLLLLKNVIG